jgi:pimeloyl-ACP methyl ester carboxylesterase
VPLEFEPSAALAYGLEHSDIWKAELRGYRSGSYRSDQDGLWALHPYRKGRIPVVFVHGTASSPARWAELVNEIQGDPVLGDRYQQWLFFYNTGNPILYSAAQLRDFLRGAVQEIDPDGTDPTLRRMVLIGHSQGGILTRLAVVESGDLFWDAASGGGMPFADLDVSDDTRALLSRALFFSPVEAVTRVIFIATPHGGSYLASWRLGNLAAKLVQLPVDLARSGTEIFTRNPELAAAHKIGRMPSSVDNMKPDSPFTQALLATQIPPRVHVHSIVAVKGEGPFQGGNDGVVEYRSAHYPEAESELVVRSGHSTQGNPSTVEEVRRVLLEHLEQP